MKIYQEIVNERSGPIQIRCKSCGEATQSDATEQKVIDKLYGLIPVWVTRRTMISCSNCGTSFRSNRSIDELSMNSADQNASSVSVDVAFIYKFMVAIGCVFFFVPFLAFILSLVSYFCIQKAAPGWRRMALIGMVLGLLSTILVLGFMISELSKP